MNVSTPIAAMSFEALILETTASHLFNGNNP
jgi:hypothetical protein